MIAAISITAQTAVLFIGTLDAAEYFHNCLLNSVFHWPVVAFDHIPFGRLLNRFGFDIDVLDSIPKDLLQFVTYTGVVSKEYISHSQILRARKHDQRRTLNTVVPTWYLLISNLNFLFQVMSSLLVISFNTPLFLSTLLPLGGIYYFTQVSSTKKV